MRRFPWALVMAVAVVTGLAVPAAAQPQPWQLEQRTTAGWTFTPGGSLGGMWDSGIQTSNHPIVEALFQKWVGVFNPRAELDFNGRRGRLNAGYSGAFEKYWGSESGYEQHARLGASRALSRRITAAGDASYASAPTTDRLAIVDGVIPFVDIQSTWVNAGGAMSFQATQRTNVDLGYRFERVTLDRPLESLDFGTLKDGRSHAPSLRVSRAFTQRLSVGIDAEYRREIVGRDEETFDVQTAGGAFTYRWSPLMSIFGGGGASRLEVVDIGAVTIAPTFHGGFEQTARGMRLRAQYQRAFRPLFGFGSLASNHTVSASVLVPLREREYYVTTELAYSRTQPVTELGLGFELDTLWTDVAVGRQLGEWVRGEAFLSVSHQGSSGGGSNRTRVGIQFVTSKPLRMQ